MNATKLNPRMTIVIVFAFLFIVALFMHEGGAADQATSQLSDAAREASGARPAPKPSPAARRTAWFSPDADPVVPPPPPQANAANAPEQLPEGAAPMVAPDPPPQGPDFPENRFR